MADYADNSASDTRFFTPGKLGKVDLSKSGIMGLSAWPVSTSGGSLAPGFGQSEPAQRRSLPANGGDRPRPKRSCVGKLRRQDQFGECLLCNHLGRRA